jgi:REP element-mobilizing transposase RayT
MARPRWIAPWKDSTTHPPIYHLISRVVERRFAFGPEEKEKFRTLMRMTENFTGCQVLSYCLMSNHFHLLLEVPPPPADGLSDELLLQRLRALYPKPRVNEVRTALEQARARGEAREVARIHECFTYRMHDLSEFMKTLLQRFSSWFNRRHERTGRLWEQRFKSVLVEDGTAARTMAAYIDLNPVRAGICEDPADYRWSSYAEAVAGGRKARAGLVRALRGHQGAERVSDETGRGWVRDGLARDYRAILLGKGVEVVVDGEVKRRGMKAARRDEELAALARHRTDLRISKGIRHRVRYFTDGAVIGGRGFVDGVFRECRQYFGPRRKDAARKPRGALRELAGEVWTARDLRTGVG